MDHYLQKFDLFIFYHQRADPDLWMRKTAEGGYYYIARYIDDVMYFSKNPEKIIHYLENLYIERCWISTILSWVC